MLHVTGIPFVPRVLWRPEDGPIGWDDALFQVGLPKSAATLRYELERINARNARLEVALTATQLTKEGRPRAGSKAPTDSGVVLVADVKEGELRYAAGRYTRWQDNVRALALSLEALRAVGRWGVLRGEQYRGNLALPSPNHTLILRGRALIAEHGDARSAKRIYHPDNLATGDAEAFRAITAAEEAQD